MKQSHILDMVDQYVMEWLGLARNEFLEIHDL